MVIRAALNVLRYLWDGLDFLRGKGRRGERAERHPGGQYAGGEQDPRR
jgi:hypothetical protein